MSYDFNEKEFIDTMADPSSVPEFVDGESNDPTKLPEIDKEIAEGQKDSTSVKLANFIRTKMFGADVRETIARAILWFSVLYNRMLSGLTQLLAKVNLLEKEFDGLSEKLDEVVGGQTQDNEVKLARVSKYYNKTFLTIGRRMDRIELENYKRISSENNLDITLEDDSFSANFETQAAGQVESSLEEWPLVISAIGTAPTSEFHLEKVGEI
ncbi:MAG: hypothetical protein ACTH54_09880 [Vagococcus salmoninarum]|uniref:hypothetical protein n=1 Tax=Vagococcus salmoninarum TaxID=2739 RepID=UPI003F9E9A0A